MTTALQDLEARLQATIGGSLIGMQSVVRALTTAVVARGHVLVQGVPGLGKTRLSKALAAALGGSFKRIQGTADLMPSDIIGVHVYEAATSSFVFRRGPLFADVLLFDEINRTGPKTQSALLEAMEERQVSAEGRLYTLAADFFVIATQNPRDFEGTYPLPESQLDRFMMRIDIGYPSAESEVEVLARFGALDDGTTPAVEPVAAGAIAAARRDAEAVHVAPELTAYVQALARATREHARLELGLSTRGALAVIRAARITAGLNGADFATPDDVRAVLPLVVPHRLLLATDAVLDGIGIADVVAEVTAQVEVPR
ncbi:MAG TPA: MoxR family ATPase [Steroidobacteraceae bacterium]|nr:MoxR family ATPase [Steroidobacteraceae bacterium]